MSWSSQRAAVWSLSVAAALAAGGWESSDKHSDEGANPTALSAETRSAATGDIPDNQAFLVFRNPAAGYAIEYPEGWMQIGSGYDVTFKDKHNLVHVVAGPGQPPSVKQADSQLIKLGRSNSSLLVTSRPKRVTIKGAEMIKSRYSTRSARNPVTGKRVTLEVDRYQLADKGRVATVELGTPRGIDNVEAYRLMIESFRWL